MTLLSRLRSQITPLSFAQRSLASQLGGVFAIEAKALQHAIDEARERIAATPAAELRRLARRPTAERAGLAVLHPIEAPAEAAETGDERFAARIPIVGTIVKGDASCARMMGIDATGLDEVRRALVASHADPQVAEIVLEVDSPGGTALGVQEVADLIGAIAKEKPVRAEVSGVAASAALWLISQASEITAEPSSLVGSLGVFAAIADTSAAAEREGIKVHVVRSGPHKGAGTPGTPVTEEQLAAEQVVVDDLAGLFAASVAEGRGLEIEAVMALTTGEVWIASKALSHGLIDSVRAVTKDAREGGDTASAHAGAVQEDNEMSKDDLAALAARMSALEEANQKLAARNARLKKKKNEAAAANKVLARGAIDQAIARGVSEGRITPAMQAKDPTSGKSAIDEYAELCAGDVAKLETFLATLPVQVTATAIGSTPRQMTGGAPSLTAEERKAMKVTGATLRAMQAIGDDDVQISIDGKSVKRNGSWEPISL